MNTRKAKDRYISNCLMVIALILGVSVAVVVSTTGARAQNQASSQMATCPTTCISLT